MTAKSKSQMMKEMRRIRKESGLVEFRCWMTEEQKKIFVDFSHAIDRMDAETLGKVRKLFDSVDSS